MKTKVPSKISKVVLDRASELMQILPTAKVKSASLTRAGNSIQVRVAWKNPDGTPGLGYMSSTSITSGRNGIVVRAFAEMIFRFDAWGKKMYVLHGDPGLGGIGWTTYTHFLKEVLLNDTDFFKSDSPLIALCNEANDKMFAVAKTGKHHKIRAAHKRERAVEHVKSALDYALRNGVSDDDIREMLKLAFVKHTHDA